MKCPYCLRKPGEKREGLDVDVCDSCWDLLQNPVTALPLIRGHLTVTLRGQIPDAELKRKIDTFMSKISAWKRPG